MFIFHVFLVEKVGGLVLQWEMQEPGTWKSWPGSCVDD